MRFRLGKKLGDTLVEVTIAIGIFSMVAVAVVSVVSSSTSGAQSALETTIAREEIDAQAEALRFIQNLDLSDTATERGTKIWKKIASLAVDPTDSSLIYSPDSCASLYNNNRLKNDKAFIINTRKLRDGSADDIIVRNDDTNGSKFMQATTYPRIIYGSDSEQLYSQNYGTSLKSIEGIFIIAVKDNNATNVVAGADVEKRSAFYDFYIRTCWYGASANTPTTISTVVRLYNPNIDIGDPTIATEAFGDDITFDPNDGLEADEIATGSMAKQHIASGLTSKLSQNKFDRYYYEFNGWCKELKKGNQNECKNGTKLYADKDFYTADGPIDQNRNITLYATWKEIRLVTIQFNSNGGSCNHESIDVPLGRATNEIYEKTCSRDNHDFLGWKDKWGVMVDKDHQTYTVNPTNVGELKKITLTAQWKEKDKNVITFNCGKDADGNNVSSKNITQTIYNGSPQNLTSYSAACNTPANHTFKQWDNDTKVCNAKPTSFKEGAEYSYNSTCKTSGRTLTAQWERNLEPTLTAVVGKAELKKNEQGQETEEVICTSEIQTGAEQFVSGKVYSHTFRQGTSDSGEGTAEDTEKKFTISLNGYSSASLEIGYIYRDQSPGNLNQGWGFYDKTEWGGKGYKVSCWPVKGGGTECNYDHSSWGPDSNTFSITKSESHTLKTKVQTNDHSWARSCIVVKDLTLKLGN